jgi:small subunit ribosomal protein S3
VFRLRSAFGKRRFRSRRARAAPLAHEKRAAQLKPDVSAQLVAENVAEQLVRRGSFRRAMKRAVENAMREGAKGCNVKISGRLGGAEIARVENDMQGSVPLNSLNTKIDYGYAVAKTGYGIIGVRVWVNHGKYSDLNKEG